MQRIARLTGHIEPQACGSATAALPPTAELEEGFIFPTFPQLLAARQKFGGVFTYNIYGGHRMTFIADPAVWRLVFFAKGCHCHEPPPAYPASLPMCAQFRHYETGI